MDRNRAHGIAVLGVLGFTVSGQSFVVHHHIKDACIGTGFDVGGFELGEFFEPCPGEYGEQGEPEFAIPIYATALPPEVHPVVCPGEDLVQIVQREGEAFDGSGLFGIG